MKENRQDGSRSPVELNKVASWWGSCSFFFSEQYSAYNTIQHLLYLPFGTILYLQQLGYTTLYLQYDTIFTLLTIQANTLQDKKKLHFITLHDITLQYNSIHYHMSLQSGQLNSKRYIRIPLQLCNITYNNGAATLPSEQRFGVMKWTRSI